jgi:hypothetical protein
MLAEFHIELLCECVSEWGGGGGDDALPTTTSTITDKKYITKTDITTFDWNWGGFGILIHAVGT